jgi:hypothetical protein
MHNGVAVGAWALPGGLVDQRLHRQRGESLAKLVGGGEHQMPQAHNGADPHRPRRALGHQQRSQGFDVAGAGLGEPADSTRQRPPGGLDRIQLVALAIATTRPSVCSIDLDHHQPAASKMTRQARPIGAGALDPDPLHDTERGEARDHSSVPGRCRREGLDTQHPTVGVDDRGHVNVQMRVDTARHQTRRTYDGHVIPFLC